LDTSWDGLTKKPPGFLSICLGDSTLLTVHTVYIQDSQTYGSDKTATAHQPSLKHETHYHSLQ